MANSRGGRPKVVTRCMGCGKPLVIVGPSGELEVVCDRQKCRQDGTSTPIRPAGFIQLPEGMAADEAIRLLDVVKTGRIPKSVIEIALDPFYDYRQIEGLFVIGSKELDTLFRSKENPLGIEPGWIPDVPLDSRLDAWIHSCIWRDDRKWQTRAALVLTPPSIGGAITSLVQQNRFFGIEHDGIGPGIIRKDVFWSNSFVGQPNCGWANESAVPSWQWLLLYEHPLWTAEKEWVVQQEAAKQKGMPIATAAEDAWALNMILAVYGVRLRESTLSRTATIVGGYPLGVYSRAFGVRVSRLWAPAAARERLSASVQGVPRDFVP